MKNPFGHGAKTGVSAEITSKSLRIFTVSQQNHVPPHTDDVAPLSTAAVTQISESEFAEKDATVLWRRYLDSQLSTSPTPKVVRHRFLGTKCRVNDVCIGGGECRSGFCRCPENLFEREGRCLRGA